MRRLLLAALLIAAFAGAMPVGAQTLTDKDRADIQDLTARYARALGSCAAEDYAELFAPETGYFASNIRGEVVGRERASLHGPCAFAQCRVRVAEAGANGCPLVVVECRDR
jgi:hypothetical protein